MRTSLCVFSDIEKKLNFNNFKIIITKKIQKTINFSNSLYSVISISEKIY